MQVSLSGAEFQQIMNEAIAQTATTEAGKTASVAVIGGNNLSISYTGASGNLVTMDPIELEAAEDGGILADSQAIKDLVDKIEKMFSEKDIQLDQKQVDEFTKCLGQAVDNAKTKDAFSSIHDTYVCIFAIMRLLQEANHTMKKAAQAERAAAMASQIQAIYNQADMERDAALTGLYVAIAVAALQIVASAGMKGKELSADFKADKVLADKGVLANEKIMENAKLVDSPKAAETDVVKFGKGMNNPTMKQIAAEVGGFTIDDKTGKPVAASAEGLGGVKTVEGEPVNNGVANARADLADAIKTRDTVKNAEIKETEGGKFKYEGNDAEFDTKEAAEKAQGAQVKELNAKIDSKKAAVVKAADAQVGKIKAARDNAETELAVAKQKLANAEAKAKWTRPGSAERKAVAECKKEVADCQTKLDNLNKDVVFASAIRTNLFAQGVSGEPLLSREGCKMYQGAAKAAYHESLEMATNTAEYKLTQHDSKVWSMVDKCTDYFCGMLGALPNSLSGILRAEAEKQGAEKVKADSDYATANDLVQAIAQSQAKVVEMFTKIFDSWLSTMQRAMV